MEPVRRLPGEEAEPEPAGGRALCLSGGGYRAMIFHAGVLWRLCETGELARLDRVSSVSGGSITAATLALAWDGIAPAEPGAPDRYAELVVEPLRELARHTIDIGSVLAGLIAPDSIGEHVAEMYRERLFGESSLQDLPAAPRFIFNATNADSGELWLFSREYMGDWRVGRIQAPDLDVAVAAAASSAFPPFLSPHVIDLAGAEWTTEPSNDLTGHEHRDEAVLSDGGVYDNLGLEAAWKRCRHVLVSDAGGGFRAEHDPERDWPRHILRVLQLIDNQVRTLRKRQVVESYKAGTRTGAYLGIRSDSSHYELADALPSPHAATLKLADTPTRLAALDDVLQERLVNWGYAICDAALRAHVEPGLEPPAGYPYPRAGVG